MIQRQLDLERTLGEAQSAFLFGPRGVGKTFLAKRFLAASGHGLAIDLLNLDVYRRYVTDLALFRREIEHAIGERTVTVFVDEVQKFPALLDEVHYLIEEYKPRVRFLLTGSSARKLRRGGANLLAGRAWTLMLHPLSSSEVQLDLQRALSFGTLPAIYLGEGSQVRSLTAYVDTYLREEIFVEALVRKSESFIRFLDLAGQINGEPVNHSKLGRAAGVSSKTVQEYFSILVDTLVALRVDGWSHSVRKQLRQSPKYYFFDCGVLNAIRGEIRSELRPHTYRYGKLFETFVVNEVQRRNDYKDLGYRLYYWRTSTGREVDLVLSRGPSDRPRAIEIKSDSAPTEAGLRGLLSFRTENPSADLLCFCTTPRAYQLGDIKVLPWQEGLLEL